MTSNNNEPLIRIAKRDNNTLFNSILVRVIAIALSFLIILIVTSILSGFDFGKIIVTMFENVFSSSKIADTFKDTCMLLCIAIALAPVFKMKYWNTGAQGQVLVGALFASFIIQYFGDLLPNWLTLILMFIASVIGGGLWALLPGIFKVKTNANETLFTLMMNYVAVKLVAAFIDDWKGQNEVFPPFTQGGLPEIFGISNGITYIILIALVVLMFIYMDKTKHGYEISILGESTQTAKYAGMNISKVMLRTIILSGAICGVCGFLYMGNDHSLATTISGNYGFTAIIVAWASHFNTFAMSAMSFAIVFLERGAIGIYNVTNVFNGYIKYIFVSIFLFFIIGCEFFINYRVIFSTKVREFFDKIGRFFKNIFVKKQDKEDK